MTERDVFASPAPGDRVLCLVAVNVGSMLTVTSTTERFVRYALQSYENGGVGAPQSHRMTRGEWREWAELAPIVVFRGDEPEAACAPPR